MIKRVDSIPQKDCTACSVCLAVCPQNCIEMKADKEGFLYPFVDIHKCIECEECYTNCPSVNFNKEALEPYKNEVYACQIIDENIRRISSSGGAFSALSYPVLNLKGYVCGVSYTSDFKAVRHTIVNNEKELDDLRRSKLLQSDKNDIFLSIEKLLKEGQRLLFSGTPCEVFALKSFLAKEYKYLYTCDLICGCVASPKIYRKYLEHLENKYNSRIKSVNFKDKSKGWQERGIRIDFENGKSYVSDNANDPYMVSFHSRYGIRPSCFNCKFRGMDRLSDITLGDFWGLKYYHKSLDDNQGTSYVMVNSQKGKDLLMETKRYMHIQKMDIDITEYSNTYNLRVLNSPSPADELNRSEFYNDLDVMEFDELFDKHLKSICLERKRKKEEYLRKLEAGIC
ncbi:MAG: Coenzyme F420 hydrogenase/dehydrogenase, beta subunit C-terminal domain [Bacteroidales bacterium]|jgi:coenzyme F420-reducing hydrogenase beta subunit|nr:Coenzyme F420 hydrogenase/dehydrogenase, beta subunit C-terminal domain [Bacteroidales bacterium]MDD2617801.1 Coenzyme F420 hydrogenase/dehydrogenase, beta subunit C-terminal domain [Bacteroidales bacterium]MDD4640452.1 Coenzyme F420 hydrogenase/dehydrogenase, beta subunit C-terminal domain [Bacteroidales bacterium]